MRVAAIASRAEVRKRYAQSWCGGSDVKVVMSRKWWEAGAYSKRYAQVSFERGGGGQDSAASATSRLPAGTICYFTSPSLHSIDTTAAQIQVAELSAF